MYAYTFERFGHLHIGHLYHLYILEFGTDEDLYNEFSTNNVDIFKFIRPEVFYKIDVINKDLLKSREITCTRVSFSISLQVWSKTLIQERLRHRLGEIFLKALILQNICE